MTPICKRQLCKLQFPLLRVLFSWCLCLCFYHDRSTGMARSIPFSDLQSSRSPEGSSTTPAAGKDELDVRQSIIPLVDTLEEWKTQKFANSSKLSLPFITVTYAQTLDGKIATRYGSSNLPISGGQGSLQCTHALRAHHDAILVGGKTWWTDNPRLNNRLWKKRLPQPCPVILDPHLTWLHRFVNENVAIRAQRVLVCCGEEAWKKHHLKTKEERHEVDVDHNVEFLACHVLPNGRLDLRDVLRKLRDLHDIRSIMVEGGASVLNSFCSSNLVDCVVITVAPKLLGSHGLSAPDCPLADESDSFLLQLTQPKFAALDCDCILMAKWPQHNS